MKVHLWEAYNLEKISVDLKQNVKDKLRDLIKGNIYNIAMELDILPARLYNYFIYQDFPIPLRVLIKFSKRFNIPLIEIEKKIIMYKHMFVPRKNSVKEPKLPIEINPYFTSIIAHFYFDGSIPNDGKGTYYNQKNEKIMNDFIDKIKIVFGDVYYSVMKDHRGVLKCRIPRIIGEICKTIYGISSFGTFNSRVSKKIFNLSKENRMAFILTAILDEGSITYDGDIFFGVSNMQLCTDVQKLCSQIGLKTTVIKGRPNGSYYFYIKSKERFLQIIKEIFKKYPLLNLRYKKERLQHYFKVKKYPGLRNKKGGDKRKKRILIKLKTEKTINGLSKELLIPPKSLRRHLYALINQNKVKRKKKGNQYYYFLASSPLS